MSNVPPAATPKPARGAAPAPTDGSSTAARGGRLGLPTTGPGSLAPTSRRLAAFVLDCVASALVAALFTVSRSSPGGSHSLPGSWSLIPFALIYLVGLPLAGRTLGMNLFGIRVVRVDRPTRITVLDAAVRTILLALLVPAIIWDKDGRGLHDRLARTAVVLA
jgi:uncharacterized RDD family membrane protein YckC